MEIHRLARKLEPLAPERIKRWRRNREFADAETQSLLDKQLLVIAHRFLRDDLNQPLLSLPPKKLAFRQIQLGTVLYAGSKWPLGISKAELLQSLAIFGRSGAGKTNTAFLILTQLVKQGIPFLFLDWKRTGRSLLPHLNNTATIYTPGRSLLPFPFNPFIAPPGVELAVYANHAVDVLGDAYTLGDGARSIVHRALLDAYAAQTAPTADDLIKAIDALPNKERMRGWKVSAIRALESLSLVVSGTNADDQKALAGNLLQQSTILELDGLPASAKKFLIPLVCYWIYSARLAAGANEKLAYVIVVEEAHHLLHGGPRSGRETLMEMMLRQCRELGIAMLVIDQHPALISSAALGNCYTSICHNLKDPRDARKAAELSLLEEHDRQLLSRLPVGQAVVKLQDRWSEPVLIQVPEVLLKKGSVSDSDLLAVQRGVRADSGRYRRHRQSVGRIPRLPMTDVALSPEALRFLDDVLAHRESGVRNRYLRLGMSAGRGSRLKENLVEAGWLDSLVVPEGNSRKVILRLSGKARAAFGIETGKQRHESLEHEYWKHRIAKEYRRRGYAVTIEAPRVGGRVDVLAERDGKRVGIEIETGKSDVVGNVKNSLRSGFDQVVVVGTSEDAVIHVEKSLATVGLLISNRLALRSTERRN